MKFKRYFMALLALTLCCCNSKRTPDKSFGQAEISGTWKFESETSEFELTLVQNGDVLSGSHCSIMRGGNRVDCADIDKDGTGNEQTIRGKRDGKNWILHFYSTYCEKEGIATIAVKNQHKLAWLITKEPDGEFYIPDEVTLVRTNPD